MSVRAPRSEQVEEVLAAVKALRALGMRLAQALVDEVEGSPSEDQPAMRPAEAAIAFQRIAKAVRMTVALELRVLDEAGVVREGEARAGSFAQERAAQERRRQGASKRIAVADVMAEVLTEISQDIDAERHQELDEDLQEWFHERRDDEEFAGMDEREMLESVCAALGLVPDPRLWDQGDYVEAIAAAVLRPKIRPETPVGQAVAAARANFAHQPEATGPP
ncbi:MAG TPA: hypothetical protein VFN88_10575, partial [Caulobacteraceae bacterium]|nr:hypothetical protein [Caulobacteraceae bacterium]